MKRIEDYSKEELNKLTEEQVEKIIEIECAFEGKPFVPEMPMTPILKEIVPDKVGYKIAGFILEDFDSAMTIQQLLMTMPLMIEQRDYNVNASYLIPADEYNNPKVVKCPYFTKAYLESVKTDKIRSDKELKEYKAAIAERDKIIKDREKISMQVRGFVEDAQSYFYNRSKIVDEYNKYLALAEGNTEIAWKFLVASKGNLEDFEGIKEECMNLQEAE